MARTSPAFSIIFSSSDFAGGRDDVQLAAVEENEEQAPEDQETSRGASPTPFIKN